MILFLYEKRDSQHQSLPWFRKHEATRAYYTMMESYSTASLFPVFSYLGCSTINSEQNIGEKRGKRKQKNTFGNLTKGCSSLGKLGSGIPSDWSVLTGFVNT